MKCSQLYLAIGKRTLDLLVSLQADEGLNRGLGTQDQRDAAIEVVSKVTNVPPDNKKYYEVESWLAEAAIIKAELRKAQPETASNFELESWLAQAVIELRKVQLEANVLRL